MHRRISSQLLASPPISLDLATQIAATYANRYAHRRGAMVVDVVASAARNYDRVEPTAKAAGISRLVLDHAAVAIGATRRND